MLTLRALFVLNKQFLMSRGNFCLPVYVLILCCIQGKRTFQTSAAFSNKQIRSVFRCFRYVQIAKKSSANQPIKLMARGICFITEKLISEDYNVENTDCKSLL